MVWVPFEARRDDDRRGSRSSLGGINTGAEADELAWQALLTKSDEMERAETREGVTIVTGTGLQATAATCPNISKYGFLQAALEVVGGASGFQVMVTVVAKIHTLAEGRETETIAADMMIVIEVTTRLRTTTIAAT